MKILIKTKRNKTKGVLNLKRIVCALCGKEIGDNEEMVFCPQPGGWYQGYHLLCLCQRVKSYEDFIEPLKRMIAEIDSKGAVAINNNLIIYKKDHKIYLKVTDYMKGYWAEVPLTPKEIQIFFAFLKINFDRANKKFSKIFNDPP